MKTGSTFGIVPDGNNERVRCAFCGVYMPKVSSCIEQHTNGSKHKENIDLMLENGISFSDGVLSCKPCARVLADDESVSKHLESDDHANWMTVMEDLTDGEFISLEPYLSYEKDEVHCEACNQTIECTMQKIEQHVNSLVHRTNVCDKVKPLNGIFPADINMGVWCKVCDAYLENTVTSILEHIDDDEQHVNWMSDIEDLIDDQDISIEEFLSDHDHMNAYCNACHIEILCNLQSIEEHIFSETHLNNLS